MPRRTRASIVKAIRNNAYGDDAVRYRAPVMPKPRHPLINPTLRQIVALRLQQLRIDYGEVIGRPLRQPAFAALLGLKTATWGSYERGDREPPLAVLASLRRVTGVSLDSLLSEVPNEGHHHPVAEVPR